MPDWQSRRRYAPWVSLSIVERKPGEAAEPLLRPEGLPSPDSLAQRLEGLSKADAEYWSFIDRDERDFLHSLIRYPAMMVPRLQRELLAECIAWDRGIRRVYDPFVGSGTVMTETMLLGRDFVGSDINPLAVLACRAKSEFLDGASLERDLKRLLSHIDADGSGEVDIHFPTIEKWFEPHVLIGLSKIRRAIMARPHARTRRFWWIVLAEVIRLVSNSRTSTVKLHIRPEIERRNRPDALEKFKDVAVRSVQVLATQQKQLAESEVLRGAKYAGSVDIRVADVREELVAPADLLMTSPPYGDNHTTVTYGQASYLPLQWIDGRDISPDLDRSLLASTHATDTASLGGSRKNALAGAERALDRSATLRRYVDSLAHQPRDRQVRVAAFFRDLDAALERIDGNLKPGAPMLWTVGDRSVGGQRIPLATVITQLLGRKADFVTELTRTIPVGSKRMPSRNSISQTMATETILVLRKSL